MTQTHSNTKKRNYTHLNDIERGHIVAYLEQGLSLRDIAKNGRNVSTISREKKRAVSNKSILLAILLRSIFLMPIPAFMKRTGAIANLILPSCRHGNLLNSQTIKL